MVNLSVILAMFSYLASYYLRMVMTAQRKLRAGEDFSAAVSRADMALYRGETSGRNRVELETI